MINIEAKVNEVDSEMVELVTETKTGRKTLWGVVHADCFSDEKEIYRRLVDGQTVILSIELVREL
jgi:hypothetical protein